MSVRIGSTPREVRIGNDRVDVANRWSPDNRAVVGAGHRGDTEK